MSPCARRLWTCVHSSQPGCPPYSRFETSPFGRSGTSPREILQGLRTCRLPLPPQSFPECFPNAPPPRGIRGAMTKREGLLLKGEGFLRKRGRGRGGEGGGHYPRRRALEINAPPNRRYP